MTGDKQHDATTELNEALAAGFAAGNFDGVGPFYTEDASLMPPRGKFLEGRAAACAFWLNVSNRYGLAAFTTVDVKALGDAVRRETGTYAMGGADGQAAQGKYVFVWQLVEGEWQIESSIWNRNADMAGGGGRQGQGQGQGLRRQGGGGRGGLGAGGGGQAGGYRQGGGGQGGGGQGGGYRQGGGRPSFQRGGVGGGSGGGRRQGGGPGGGQGGYGGGGAGASYDGNAGLYANPKD